jgi:2-polyprenyl-3-methyl-5-hydroxy-6-metoxy-1,4-benzoquinol methylase
VVAVSAPLTLDQLVRALPGEKTCILRHLPAQPRSILDIGCGDGRFAFCLSQAFPQARVVAIDGDRAYVDQARNAYQRDNLRFEHGYIADLGEEASFDVVVFSEVIEHLPNVGQNLAVINRVTRDGGHLLLSTDNAFSLDSLYTHVFHGFRKGQPYLCLWHHQDRYYWWNHHLYAWTLHTLCTLANLYGFEVEDYWFTNHYRTGSLRTRAQDLITAVLPPFRRKVVGRFRKVGKPTIVERAD